MACLVAAVLAWAGLVLAADPAGTATLPVSARDPIPLLAYYYIWFDVASWDRAKVDFPLLGRYDSDDRAVMEQHVRWAREAGIDGFIVSWKSTDTLDRRLERLMEVAAAERFPLWIIYQGLDHQREPLPIDRIDSDLEYFVDHYADHPAFAMYDKPVVIWSGTWAFSPQDVFAVTSSYRERLAILATERNLEGYLRLAPMVDGNAYYWASVNPDTFPGYEEKLRSMGQAVHERHGLWVAPAAPGFDARLVGGSSVVERRDGETLRRELDAALLSSPDAIGLISWNEFSENTHVEPSERYGTQALELLADRQAGAPPSALDFDSSDPGTTDRSDRYGLFVVSGFLLLFGGSVVLVFMRNRAALLAERVGVGTERHTEGHL